MKKAFVLCLVLLALICGAYTQGGVFATASAQASASSGFTNQWWLGNRLGSRQALAQANAQIYVQGCTPAIRQVIVQAQASAQVNGAGDVFASAFASAEIVGPGLQNCYLNQVAQASASATATWASNNGDFPLSGR